MDLMRMFRITMGIAAAALVVGAAWADDASRTAKAEELMQLTNSDQSLKQMVDHARDITKAQTAKTELPDELKDQAQQIQDKMAQAIADHLNWDKLKPAFLKLYTDTFTEEELDGMIAFYKSPAGKAVLAKMPALTPKWVQTVQSAMRDAQADSRRIVEEAKNPK
jgi:hypothetical protein